MRGLRIGLVIYGPLDRRSGGYSYDCDLVERLRADGHELVVRSLSPPGGPGAGPTRLSRLDLADRDIVIIDELVHDGLELDRPPALAGGFPLLVGLVHHLGILESPSGAAGAEGERLFLRGHDAFIFNSRDTRDRVAAFAFEGRLRRPHSLHLPPLHLPSALPPPAAEAEGTGHHLLFLANIVPRKNLDGLLRALALLAADPSCPPFILEVVGSPSMDPEYAGQCGELARRNALDGRVRFHGRLDDAELEELWRRCDLLALPSHHEGWGMVYPEAMARGLVVLGGRSGGAAEAIGNCGLLADPADPSDIARAVGSFLTGGDAVRPLRARARARAAWLATASGFDGLGDFLVDLVDHRKGIIRPPVFDFQAFLEHKQGADDRSLHPRILDAALGELPATAGILDLGGGTGSMALRLRADGRVSAGVRYHLVDAAAEQVARATKRCKDCFGPGRFRAETADFYEFLDHPARQDESWDLVVAHAFLDLLDPGQAAAALSRANCRRLLLTQIFDGLTEWLPALDPGLDAEIAAAYHRSMDERCGQGGEGGSASGRAWLEALPRAGLKPLDAAASDWVLLPGQGDPVFLAGMLHFVESSLAAPPGQAIDGLDWWLARRRAQLGRGGLGLVVHQLDILAAGNQT